MVKPVDNRPSFNDKGIKRYQGIIVALLYVEITVNNKILVELSAIGSHKSAETVEPEDAIEQLLDYIATYPDDGILFRKSDMILVAHSDTGLFNEFKSRSIAGAHIFLSEKYPKPKLNGPVLTIAQIIKICHGISR